MGGRECRVQGNKAFENMADDSLSGSKQLATSRHWRVTESKQKKKLSVGNKKEMQFRNDVMSKTRGKCVAKIRKKQE